MAAGAPCYIILEEKNFPCGLAPGFHQVSDTLYVHPDPNAEAHTVLAQSLVTNPTIRTGGGKLSLDFI